MNSRSRHSLRSDGSWVNIESAEPAEYFNREIPNVIKNKGFSFSESPLNVTGIEGTDEGDADSVTGDACSVTGVDSSIGYHERDVESDTLSDSVFANDENCKDLILYS